MKTCFPTPANLRRLLVLLLTGMNKQGLLKLEKSKPKVRESKGVFSIECLQISVKNLFWLEI